MTRRGSAWFRAGLAHELSRSPSAIRDVSFEPSDSPSVWLCAALDLLMS